MNPSAKDLRNGPRLASRDVRRKARVGIRVVFGGVAKESFVGHRTWDGIITWAFRTLGIENHVNRLLHFDAAGLAGGANLSHVDCHGLPRGVEELMSIEKGSNASFALAREELKERGEILGANDFPGKGAMQKVGPLAGSTRSTVACGLEAHFWSGRPCRVNKVERRAE